MDEVFEGGRVHEGVRWCLEELRSGWMNVGLFVRWVLDFVTEADVPELAEALLPFPEVTSQLSELAVTDPQDIIVTGSAPLDPASPRVQAFFAAWRAHFGLDGSGRAP